jgi:hypothetical protein
MRLGRAHQHYSFFSGHLRHCTFVAMRDDKKAAEVVRET